MLRTPEPELMDDEEQAIAYANADFSASDRSFVATFLAGFDIAQGARVLDLGCGPGNIAFILAELRPDLEIIGWDGAPTMIGLAMDLLGSRSRISFEVRRLPIDDIANIKAFDAIVSNSLLHHLHEPQVMWHTIVACGRPGTAVFVQDLRRPPSPEVAETIVATCAASDPPVLQRDFLASLHAAFEPAEVRAQLEAAGLGTFEVAAVAERHLRISGCLT